MKTWKHSLAFALSVVMLVCFLFSVGMMSASAGNETPDILYLNPNQCADIVPTSWEAGKNHSYLVEGAMRWYFNMDDIADYRYIVVMISGLPANTCYVPMFGDKFYSKNTTAGNLIGDRLFNGISVIDRSLETFTPDYPGFQLMSEGIPAGTKVRVTAYLSKSGDIYLDPQYCQDVCPVSYTGGEDHEFAMEGAGRWYFTTGAASAYQYITVSVNPFSAGNLVPMWGDVWMNGNTAAGNLVENRIQAGNVKAANTRFVLDRTLEIGTPGYNGFQLGGEFVPAGEKVSFTSICLSRENPNSIAPVALGAKILKQATANNDQNLRLDFDFSDAIANGAAANLVEYGVILKAGTVDKATLMQQTGCTVVSRTVASAAEIPEVLTVVVTNSAANSGKRVSALAYVKDAGGKYTYSANTDDKAADGVVVKSVMGVMKSWYADATLNKGAAVAAYAAGASLDAASVASDLSAYANGTIAVGSEKYAACKAALSAVFYNFYSRSDLAVSVPADGDTEQTLVYKSVNGKDIALDFLPPTTRVYEKAPVYYILSGGGWAACSRENMIAFSDYSVRKLREKGFAVVSADYRLVDDGAVMEDMVSDVMDAARYLSKYADILRIDADKIVTSGHSAGSQLALMLAYAPHDFIEESVLTDYDFTVIGTAPMSAPTVMYPDGDGKYLLSFTPNHLFACGRADSDEGRRGSPITYAATKKVPTLLMAGEKDELVYPENSIRFSEEVQKAGGDCYVILCKNAGHSFEAINASQAVEPSYLLLQDEIVRFAESLL